MNLIASLLVRNELGRYLRPCIAHLLDFCDEIRVMDDGSTDGTADWLEAQDRVHVLRQSASSFFEHEGRARNASLAWTMQGRPTHVLAIDADEFVTDGALVRNSCQVNRGPGVWSLIMEEVWKADDGRLWTRQDGGWREHPIPILWRAPRARVAATGAWQIADRQLACGRTPTILRRFRPVVPSGSSVLHFGWSCEADRAERHRRYVEADGGRFHASAHLNSIMWPDRKVRLAGREWPAGLDRDVLLARIRREAVPA